MIKYTECKNCGNKHDSSLDRCPSCRGQNFNQPDCYKNMTMLLTWKEIILFIVGWKGIELISLLFSTIANLIISYKGITVNRYAFSMGGNTFVYLCLFGILLAVINSDIPLLFKKFNNWKSYVFGVLCTLSMIAFNIIWGIFISQTYGDLPSNANESSIRILEALYPLTSLLIFGFVGPICEELTYRIGLFSGLSKISKTLAYPLVGLIFGLIHFDFTAPDLVIELLNLPPYIFAGLAFSFVYDKWGFSASLTAHVSNNLIALYLITDKIGAQIL